MIAPSAPTILHISGWGTCAFFRKTTNIVSSLSTLFPSRLRVVDHTFPSRDSFREWLIHQGFRDQVLDERAKNHCSSPFVWTSSSMECVPPKDASKVIDFVGGHDDTLAWCRDFCTPTDVSTNDADEDANQAVMKDDGHVSTHKYDYDLVVIGGGSGGLAASKEAVLQAGGASKVAVLDSVTPSPAGSTWGLGGTCVNVGCIPKKLMHRAAVLNEELKLDASVFGLNNGNGSTAADGGSSSSSTSKHSWETLRQNVQNYIRGLNFKYRVSLRENNVTYLNKRGTFKDAHTLTVTDRKGKASTLTSSRFLIAVGGRPTPLQCEGGDLAISSDDVFSLPDSPGKTLCVGASYISLECAGLLAGVGLDVTVAVRSILLRGFDRECADKIGAYMEGHSGISFKREVVPTKLENIEEKVENGTKTRIRVTFSDGSCDTYDTVLSAIGRTADTRHLGLENVGIQANARNGKILTTNEQTECSNVYAVGDVMEGCPELTPVAMRSGVLLSRRLFGAKKETMDYQNICTTVFTPIEYGTIGLNEEDAIATYGKDNIEVYHKDFMPLEWSLTDSREEHPAFTKVIVDKHNGERVIGLHFLGPNAGEVVQGYGVAVKKGISFGELQDTVGIHPTCAEEIVTLSVTKSSGKEAKAGGC